MVATTDLVAVERPLGWRRLWRRELAHYPEPKARLRYLAVVGGGHPWCCTSSST